MSTDASPQISDSKAEPPASKCPTTVNSSCWNFIFSPIWGTLADRFGRKPLLLRAYVGAMITLTLQGAAQEVWQLLLLRGLQGMFVGTIPAATALVAASAPRERVTYSLGVLQMAFFTSQLIGPIVGGLLASSIGIRPTFFPKFEVAGIHLPNDLFMGQGFGETIEEAV